MPTDERTDDRQRFLTIYLRDHLGGASAGLALTRRCCRNNAGSELAAVLTQIEGEVSEDRASLQAIMDRLGVTESRVKTAFGSTAELVGRLKGNGRLLRYSPLSRVHELEILAAGIATKRSLWRSLSVIAGERPELDAAELDRLIGRATSQLERVRAEHDRAAARAFGEKLSDGD